MPRKTRRLSCQTCLHRRGAGGEREMRRPKESASNGSPSIINIGSSANVTGRPTAAMLAGVTDHLWPFDEFSQMVIQYG